MSGRLAVVVAHPDDDTFGCSGTVALHAEDPRFRFTLIHVTSGEAGEIADPPLTTRETLGAGRQDVRVVVCAPTATAVVCEAPTASRSRTTKFANGEPRPVTWS